MKTSIIAVAGISMVLTLASPAISQNAPKATPDTEVKAPKQAMTPGKQAAFQPIALDPTMVKQSMQARSEYEDLNRKIIARQTKLYDSDPTIKDLQTKMRDIQKKIDKVLAEDEELNKLKEQFRSISPEMPVGLKKAPPSGPGTMAPMSGTPVTPGSIEKPVSAKDKPASTDEIPAGSVR